MRTTCAVYGCASTSYCNNSGELRFHQFPKDKERCQAWIKACQRPDLKDKCFESLKYLNVCSLHFEKKMYAKINLKVTAVPTLNLPSPDVSISTQTDPLIIVLTSRSVQVSEANVGTSVQSTNTNFNERSQGDYASQTPAKLTDHTPRKRNLRQKVAEHKREAKILSRKTKVHISKKQFETGCDIYLNKNLSSIVKAHINLKPHGKRNRYSKEFKLFALNMYYTSPQCYRFLAKTLCLPSKNTLSSMYIPMTTHINEHMRDALSATAKLMSLSQKECVMCMDEISLKYYLGYDLKQGRIVGSHEVDGQQRPLAAEFAFTIMLRGITSNWKQPIGFAFISSSEIDGQLADWIMNIMKNLFTMGFRIRALVSDQRSDFLQFAKSKGISKEKSFFKIDGKKIYYIFDVRHIIKCIRNNLIKNNFEYNGKTVSWDDIQMLYNLEVKKDMRSVPKLTDAHIFPNNFQRQKVRFATQVFSNSVVAALETYAASGQITPANGTVEFIKTVDNLFDLLNSSNLHSRKPYGKPFRGDSSELELLDQAQHIFNNLIIKNKRTGKDVTNTVKFTKTLIITMNSIRQMLVDMQNDGYVYLFTRRLNNDCLENFFRLIRQASGNCRKPTCLQFTRAFRKSYFCQLMQLSDGRNCSEDFDSILLKYNSFFKK
ncbi:unnamed protein product [Parnassius mnemosyne]|uniref:THAP-type domain-containing protein n=1 Tax=Parnassius mnemosyne TaxID=213953 RepID=A0AAV1LYZ4_9NEOP